jgi:hypothetical protein
MLRRRAYKRRDKDVTSIPNIFIGRAEKDIDSMTIPILKHFRQWKMLRQQYQTVFHFWDFCQRIGRPPRLICSTFCLPPRKAKHRLFSFDKTARIG